MNDPLRTWWEKHRAGEPILRDGTWLLRVGVASVFLWFGVDKFVHPGYWPMWVPAWLPSLQQPHVIAAFGVFEVAIGVLLLTGWRVREVAYVASAFLAAILVTSGVTPVVRDLGLLGATLYLALTSPGPAPADGGRVPLRVGKGTRNVVGLGLAVLLAAGTITAVGWGPFAATGDVAGPGAVLELAEPMDGAVVDGGEVAVTVGLRPAVHDLGVNHVHVRLDGRVVDALYFAPGDGSVATTLLNVEPGDHTLEAYVAYADHVEVPGSAVAVTFTAT